MAQTQKKSTMKKKKSTMKKKKSTVKKSQVNKKTTQTNLKVTTAQMKFTRAASLPAIVAIESVAFPGKYVAALRPGNVTSGASPQPWLVKKGSEKGTYAFAATTSGPWLSLGPGPTCTTAVGLAKLVTASSFDVYAIPTGGHVIRTSSPATCSDKKHHYMVFDSAGRVRFSKNPPTAKTIRQYMVRLRSSSGPSTAKKSGTATVTSSPVESLPDFVNIESVTHPGKYVSLAKLPSGANPGSVASGTAPHSWKVSKSTNGGVFSFSGTTSSGAWLSLGPSPACSTAVAWPARKSVSSFVVTKLPTGGSIIRTSSSSACSDKKYRYMVFDTAGRVRFSKNPPTATTIRNYLVHMRAAGPGVTLQPTGPPAKFSILGYWSGSPNGSANVVITPGLGTFVDASGRAPYAITGGTSDVYRFEFKDDSPMDVRALSSDVLSFPNGGTWYRVQGGGGGGNVVVPTQPGYTPTQPGYTPTRPYAPTRPGYTPTRPYAPTQPGVRKKSGYAPTKPGGDDPWNPPDNPIGPGGIPPWWLRRKDGKRGQQPTAAPTGSPFAPIDVNIDVNTGGGGNGGGFIFPVSPDLLYSGGGGVFGGGGVVAAATGSPADSAATDDEFDDDASDDESGDESGDGEFGDGEFGDGDSGAWETMPPPDPESMFSVKNIALMVCVLAILGGGYWYFFVRNKGSNANANANANAPNATNATNANAPNAGNANFGNNLSNVGNAGNAGTSNADGFDDFSNIGNIGPPPPSTATAKK